MIRPAPRPLLLGHRGSPRLRHQNTLSGFRAALAAGLDGVELDVQRSLDGVLVVHHDEHLPDGRLIAALKGAEVLAAGLPGNERVPTLEAALGWALEAGARVNVEIKASGPGSDGREGETVRLIRHLGAERLVILSSFSPLALLRVRFLDRKFSPPLETALLWAPKLEPRWLLARGRTAPLLGLAAIHPHHSLVSPQLVARAHRRGWRVNTWTVNDEALAARLIGWGVDGLIGDDPASLLNAAGRGPA